MHKLRPQTLLVTVSLLAATLGATVAQGAPTLFTSGVPYEPLVAKLKASGGDPSQTIRLRSSKDLLRLDSGKRYKFAMEPGAAIAVAPMPADAPHNEYVHPILAGGRAVATAGGLVVEHAKGRIKQVTLDQDSKSYCPTSRSLDDAIRAIARLGVAAKNIVKQDRPATCASRMN